MTADPSDSSDAEAVLETDRRKEVPGAPLSGLPPEIIDAVESVTPLCPIDHTKGKELMNSVIPCNIDQLFTMLFTNSTFYFDFQAKRKTTGKSGGLYLQEISLPYLYNLTYFTYLIHVDLNQSDWQLGEGSQKTRQLTFTVVTGQKIGPQHAQVTETQVSRCDECINYA